MGSAANEAGRSDREGPQVDVTFARPFAIAATEVTVGQFGEFIAATGYVTDEEKRGVGDVFNVNDGRLIKREGINWRHDFAGDEAGDDYPVIRVSWNDAAAFVTWLSEETGEAYRLPSEAEFEYALRAGSTTRYWWGERAPNRRVENLTGQREQLKKLRWPVAFRYYSDQHWGPAPVASFPPNPFGLHDMGGNTAEWVADCHTQSLSDQPTDGRAKNTGDCAMRVFRGGAWGYAPPLSRSAYRNAAQLSHSSTMLGFRVALDIDGTSISQAN
jgi:formylglycine-generating enzyme required for sulfatase activity